MTRFQVGDDVDTRYGPGVVVEMLGASLRVHLAKISATVKLDEWTVTPRNPNAPRPPATASPTTRAPATSTPSPQRPAASETTQAPKPPAPPPVAPRPAPTPHRSDHDPKPATRTPGATRPTPASRPGTAGTTAASAGSASVRRFEPNGAAKLRQAVEALRFGLVPTAWLKRLTIGYDHLEAWTNDLLPSTTDPAPVAAEISGPFGTGKSHACAVVRSIASERGYLVANVEVDGLRVSLSDPAMLWNAVSRTVHAHDMVSSTPLVEVYLRAITSSGKALRTIRSDAGFATDAARANYEVVRTAWEYGAAPAIAHLLENHLAANSHQPVSQTKQYIKQETSFPSNQLNLRPVIGKTVAQRPSGFVQALTALALAAEMAGYLGFVITVDEFEVEYNLTPSKIDRMRDLIDELAAYVAGRTAHAPAPIAMFFASVGQDGHAGDAIIERLLQASRGKRYELEPMDAEHRHMLAREIHTMYAEAYELEATFDPTIVDHVERSLSETGLSDSSGVARAFIKQYVGALDLAHGPPND